MSFSSGGGGGSSISTSSDVSLSNPADSQYLGYNSATAKWINKAPVTKTSNLTNDGDGTNPFPTISGATKIAVVTSLPGTPDPNTLYFVAP